MAKVDSEFWHNKWKVGDIHFHQKDVHPQLAKYFNLLTSGKVMVPLCGKSLDMLWLKSQGREVVGIELSPYACEAFFTENELEFKKTPKEKFIVFETEGITLWCGDFFEAPSETWDEVTTIYDRAALIALPPDLRRRYAGKISEWAQRKALEMLLITIDYPQEKVEGPPFSVPESEVKAFYKDAFTNIKKLDTQVDESLSAGRSKFDGVKVLEETYLLASR